MTNIITPLVLNEYFDTNVGPVFCLPSKDLMHRFGQMKGMVGIIRPQTDRNLQLFRVDWSWDPAWPHAKATYPCLLQINHSLAELIVLKPGIDIPQLVDDRYEVDWNPSKLGHVVCISESRWLTYRDKFPVVADFFIKQRKQVGVVVEKCTDSTQYTMVTFTDDKDSKVINVPSSILLRLPEGFRPKQHKKVAEPVSNAQKEKYKVGQIVRVSSSVKDENVMGLLGIVEVIHEEKNCAGVGYSFKSKFEYTVDLNVLPNRNLSLCEEEDGVSGTSVVRLAERDLDEWDEKVCDKPYFGLYRAHAKREHVWVPHRNEKGRVDVSSNNKKSSGEGMTIKVKFEEGTESMSCRDVDYLYDPDVLLATLGSSFSSLAVEQEDRNPNIPGEALVYMYVFDYAKDVGQKVSYRILLGSLLKRKSLRKKFGRALLTGKLKHPWQVRRYLKINSLGYIYTAVRASDYIEKVNGFCNAG